ncbi:hypothetical protein P153DRAFT_299574 [Dothidotthia symphoricarpi CBS 119687]|uniref:Serine/threonine-protein kinase ppk6 n=1 Tax=Dothidotthia symphoricarpi CBS 119687 TaxID=1392245 RepID=A0A6A6A1S8_9PLEO|nr:uncharacterized protein P153DRAFT_299574 [Dothidotthia symphoricarpi CBS 119687]KAF2125799.1 hypothetical protein P153DRAFT_299574 [Dothidotthia symphoricarpi CBS 119687]
MSADLFAEFGTEPGSNQQQASGSFAQASAQPAPSFGFFDDLNTTPAPVTQWQPPPPTQDFQGSKITPAPIATPAPSNDDTDDWGDFEGGSSAPDEPSSQKAPIIKAKRPTDSSVLFDAEEDLDDDDDFGDFEGTESKPTPTLPTGGSSALVDLLGDTNVLPIKPSVASKRGGGHADRKVKPAFTAQKSSASGFGIVSNPKPSSLGSTIQKVDDSWDTFDDWEASIPTRPVPHAQDKARATKSTTISTSSAAPAPVLSPTSNDPQPGELPPTNVPPPGVLLTLFSPLFAEAQDKLFKPMAAQTLPMRNKLLAEPATIKFLQGYLMLASVAAHIIAGRKLRWKRDQHLSQGMRIGPASSRATSGMKLTGIDKGENLKEEREASDVVRIWKDQVGRLRHVVSGANQIKAGVLRPVPDLQETMPVKALKQSEGGIPARQPCMLCGLKREERVTLADMEIEDSFGEWWIDQVNMHRGCRNLWNEHKDKLRQR